MSQSTVYTLIPSTAHSGSLSLSLTGEKRQAAAYYVAGRDLQTVTWSLGNVTALSPVYFVGVIVIQASLATTPGVFDWFNVYTIPVSSTSDGQSGYYNLSGNYVWLRATVTQWTQGPIGAVSVSY